MESRIFAKNWWRDLGLVKAIQKGEIAVIPTDTLYGIVGNAFLLETVENIFRLKKRNLSKPLIVLISDLESLKDFGIHLRKVEQDFLKKIWPSQISVVLPVSSEKFKFLHRGTSAVAFRMPASKNLREFLKKTGPLVAPSANPESFPPAETLEEAKKYFGNEIFGFVEAGRLFGNPSTLISLTNHKIRLLRAGAVSWEKIMKESKKLSL